MIKKYKEIIALILLSITIAFIYYLPTIYRFIKYGDLYTSVGDGLKQMIPFQMFLVQHAKQLTMFYDIGFGLGGDYFSDLSYYYSTSPFAWIGVLFVLLYQFITHSDYLLQIVIANQIVIAIFKCTCILIVTYFLFLKYNVSRMYAFIGSMLYACSTVYYYFTFTWSFFSDVMFYLPLALLGIERLFTQKKVTVLIIAIAITITSNFYFTYYEFLILACYTLYRLIFKYKKDILNLKQKVIYLVMCVLIGFLIGNFGFVQGVLSFLENDRSIINNHVEPLIPFTKQYNVLYGGFYITISFLSVIALFLVPLYKKYYFRLIATFTILSLIGSLSPYFDSFFNGFSMPERRWIYALALSTAALSSMVLQHIKLITLKQFLLATIAPLLFIAVSAIWQQSFYTWLIFIPIICILIVLKIKFNFKYINLLICIAVIAYQFTLIQNYQENVLKKYTPNKNTIKTSHIYTNKTASKIDQLKRNRVDDFRRMDMLRPISVNSQMYYDFNGTKLYSSIYNADILKFYEKDLLVSMPRNSNSYYASMSERANLNSLFNIDYTIKDQDNLHYPAHSRVIDSFKDQEKTYNIYENTLKLPSARVVQNIYNEKDLKSPLEKEHAMLNGIITKDKKSNHKMKHPSNLKDSAKISYENASYDGKQLKVNKNGGGLIINLPKDTSKKYNSLYLMLDAQIKKPRNINYYIAANENKIFKYRLTYPYVRPSHTTTANIKANNTVHLRFKKGTYDFDLKSIQGEDYSNLKNAVKQSQSQNIKFKNKHTHYEIDLNKHPSGNLVMPMLYRSGLKATVDGKKVDIKKVNYIMSSINVDKNDKKVIIKYEPPLFKTSMLATVIGIVLLIWLRRRNR
nr:YfhO family protein [Mammaliicoccus sp. Marseille-Q6498]